MAYLKMVERKKKNERKSSIINYEIGLGDWREKALELIRARSNQWGWLGGDELFSDYCRRFSEIETLASCVHLCRGSQDGARTFTFQISYPV